MNLCFDFLPYFCPIIGLQSEAVEEVEKADDGVNVVPNPSRGYARVYSQRAIRRVEVYDMSGRVVQKKAVGGGCSRVELTERLPQGCYVVRVETDQGVVAKKLVVE